MRAQDEIGVIFDCDGTLVDSMGAWRNVEATLAQRAGAQLTRADTDALTTMSIPECGTFLHQKFGLGEDAADVERMIDDFMMDFYANRSALRPGALAFMQGLAEAGVPMAVASSTPKGLLLAACTHVGIADMVETIVSVDDVGSSKRDPLVYEHTRAHLGTKRHLTWGFEDAIYAIRTLKRAGYRAYGIHDCDLSATYDQLAAEADLAAAGFEGITAKGFLDCAYALT